MVSEVRHIRHVGGAGRAFEALTRRKIRRDVAKISSVTRDMILVGQGRFCSPIPAEYIFHTATSEGVVVNSPLHTRCSGVVQSSISFTINKVRVTLRMLKSMKK